MTSRAADCEMRDVRSEVMGLLAELRRYAMNPSRVRAVTDALEVLTRSHLEPVPMPLLADARLTKSEARLIARLAEGKGACVTKQQIMDAMYFDFPNDEPNVKIVDVFICKARKKLRGTAFMIETIFGMGYALKLVNA